MNQHLYNLMPTLAAGGGEHHGASYWGLLVHIGIVFVLMFLTMTWAKRGFGERVFKNKWSQRFEQVYLFIENMCIGTIGAHGRKYVPFILTFWLVIFFGNVVALFFATAPTADLGFNLGMALVAIGYVQHQGIKGHADHLMHEGKSAVAAWTLGFFRHMSHFAGPKLGGPLVIISAMIFVIEIISELMKNVSLSLRLFGNMNGGHQAVEAMNLLGGDYIPVGGFLILIKLLTVVVQAMIFTLLTCVYLSLVTHHDEEHGHEGDPALAHAH